MRLSRMPVATNNAECPGPEASATVLCVDMTGESMLGAGDPLLHVAQHHVRSYVAMAVGSVYGNSANYEVPLTPALSQHVAPWP